MRRSDQFTRPIFGPFRRKAHTGVPADHFPKAEEMWGDGVTALLADGPATIAPLLVVWFATVEARDAFGADVEAWTGRAGPPTMAELGVLAAKHEGSLEEIADGERFDVLPPTEGDPPAPDLAAVDLSDMGHDKHTGFHSHAHSHGDGTNHTHSHFHNDANVHNHAHAAAVEVPERTGPSLHNLTEIERRRVDGANEITDPDQLRELAASAFAARGGPDAWAALRERNGMTAAVEADGTVTPGEWHAYLCAEGIRTDDGREILEGACRFPDLPVSLRLLIEDEGGHWGAVTCGRIDLMDRREAMGLQMIYAEGAFGSDENGQLAELMVEEQTQRFVSIDPRDVTGEWIEVEIRVERYDYDDDVLYDCWWRMSDLVIGAATVVSMPALPQAVIAPKSMALPESTIATESAPPNLTPITAAAGIPSKPPSSWMGNPGFHVGDARLVRQPDGSYACPPTWLDNGQGFGHVAYWNAKHTGFPGRDVRPPHSATGYAHYLTGACPCDDENCSHAVGQITMGTGHAPLTKKHGDRQVPLAAHEVIAHYDGGYGAVQMADVCVGEDDFGIWFAGALKPGVTEEQIRDFRAMGVSGDWREMAGALDLLAVLSVPAPGFPIARRALVAAANGERVEVDNIGARSGAVGERQFALVAAGVVRRVDPLERIAALEIALSELTDQVRPMAVERMRARVG